MSGNDPKQTSQLPSSVVGFNKRPMRALRDHYAAAQVHHTSRRRGGCVAARSVGAAVSGSRRIGLIANLPLPPVQRFRQRLQQLGYVEGKNLIIEYRYGEGRADRFPSFAAELVAMPVEVIVVWGNPAAFAAKRATTSIPILIGSAGDVVNTGLIANIARPESNLTGFIGLNVELEEKRLELLKEVIPRLSRVAVLANTANPLNRINLGTARRVAQRLGVIIEVVDVKSDKDVETAVLSENSIRPRFAS